MASLKQCFFITYLITIKSNDFYVLKKKTIVILKEAWHTNNFIASQVKNAVIFLFLREKCILISDAVVSRSCLLLIWAGGASLSLLPCKTCSFHLFHNWCVSLFFLSVFQVLLKVWSATVAWVARWQAALQLGRNSVTLCSHNNLIENACVITCILQ